MFPPLHFKRGDLEQSVIGALEESGLAPALLELELTESILITNTEDVLATVKRLKQLGVKLSIDDFGTGYSSLSYLKRFEVDTAQDRPVLRSRPWQRPGRCGHRPRHHPDGAQPRPQDIAEGVETEAVLALLRRFDCDEAQGYHFARPMPAEELASWRHQTASGAL